MSGNVEARSTENLISIVRQGYDVCAPKYLAWQSTRDVPKPAEYLSKLFTYLAPGASVLELGCGPGVVYTQQLANHELGLKVTAVDISASQIALARERLPESDRVEFVHADMTKLGYPEGRFDAIVALYSFFHLPGAEQGPMVRMMVSWLKPGGVLLLNTSTEEGDVFRDNWMGVKMFSTGLGVEGNLKLFKDFGEGLEVEDEIAEEKAGLALSVYFHWIWAIKK
ncbi:S-adenosyl-L-methionine-dependent methyltransferase, partial [Macrolepiota fuliginosa MF-IS2]